jgi:tetratricopeptide (TPR) repeat protein
MTHELPAASGGRLAFAWAMAGMLLLLFGAGIAYRLAHPGLLSPVPAPDVRQTAGSSDSSGSSGADDTGAFMQRLRQDPRDVEALLALAGRFLDREDWTAAETFALRAVTAAPDNARPHYLLGLALHGQKREQEAAASLEQALALGDDPGMRYSLGVLYAYYLNDAARAAEQFRRGLAAPEIDGGLREELRMELDKLPERPGPSDPDAAGAG